MSRRRDIPYRALTNEYGAAALAAFREQIIVDRGRIENADEPVFDVIVGLLDRVIAELRMDADLRQ